MGGIMAIDLDSVTVQLDGDLVYAAGTSLAEAETYIKQWPRTAGKKVLECIDFVNPRNLTLTFVGTDPVSPEPVGAYARLFACA